MRFIYQESIPQRERVTEPIASGLSAELLNDIPERMDQPEQVERYLGTQQEVQLIAYNLQQHELGTAAVEIDEIEQLWQALKAANIEIESNYMSPSVTKNLPKYNITRSGVPRSREAITGTQGPSTNGLKRLRTLCQRQFGYIPATNNLRALKRQKKGETHVQTLDEVLDKWTEYQNRRNGILAKWFIQKKYPSKQVLEKARSAYPLRTKEGVEPPLFALFGDPVAGTKGMIDVQIEHRVDLGRWVKATQHKPAWWDRIDEVAKDTKLDLKNEKQEHLAWAEYYEKNIIKPKQAAIQWQAYAKIAEEGVANTPPAQTSPHMPYLPPGANKRLERFLAFQAKSEQYAIALAKYVGRAQVGSELEVKIENKCLTIEAFNAEMQKTKSEYQDIIDAAALTDKRLQYLEYTGVGMGGPMLLKYYQGRADEINEKDIVLTGGVVFAYYKLIKAGMGARAIAGLSGEPITQANIATVAEGLRQMETGARVAAVITAINGMTTASYALEGKGFEAAVSGILMLLAGWGAWGMEAGVVRVQSTIPLPETTVPLVDVPAATSATTVVDVTLPLPPNKIPTSPATGMRGGATATQAKPKVAESVLGESPGDVVGPGGEGAPPSAEPNAVEVPGAGRVTPEPTPVADPVLQVPGSRTSLTPNPLLGRGQQSALSTEGITYLRASSFEADVLRLISLEETVVPIPGAGATPDEWQRYYEEQRVIRRRVLDRLADDVDPEKSKWAKEQRDMLDQGSGMKDQLNLPANAEKIVPDFALAQMINDIEEYGDPGRIYEVNFIANLLTPNPDLESMVKTVVSCYKPSYYPKFAVYFLPILASRGRVMTQEELVGMMRANRNDPKRPQLTKMNILEVNAEVNQEQALKQAREIIQQNYASKIVIKNFQIHPTRPDHRIDAVVYGIGSQIDSINLIDYTLYRADMVQALSVGLWGVRHGLIPTSTDALVHLPGFIGDCWDGFLTANGRRLDSHTGVYLADDMYGYGIGPKIHTAYETLRGSAIEKDYSPSIGNTLHLLKMGYMITAVQMDWQNPNLTTPQTRPILQADLNALSIILGKAKAAKKTKVEFQDTFTDKIPRLYHMVDTRNPKYADLADKREAFLKDIQRVEKGEQQMEQSEMYRVLAMSEAPIARDKQLSIVNGLIEYINEKISFDDLQSTDSPDSVVLATHVNASLVWHYALLIVHVLNQIDVTEAEKNEWEAHWKTWLPGMPSFFDITRAYQQHMDQVAHKHTNIRDYLKEIRRMPPENSKEEVNEMQTTEGAQKVVDTPTGRSEGFDVPDVSPFLKQGDIEYMLLKGMIGDYLSKLRAKTPRRLESLDFNGADYPVFIGMWNRFSYNQLHNNQLIRAIVDESISWAKQVKASDESDETRRLYTAYANIRNYKRSPMDGNDAAEYNIAEGFKAMVGQIQTTLDFAKQSQNYNFSRLVPSAFTDAMTANKHMEGNIRVRDIIDTNTSFPVHNASGGFSQAYQEAWLNRPINVVRHETNQIIDEVRSCPALGNLNAFYTLLMDIALDEVGVKTYRQFGEMYLASVKNKPKESQIDALSGDTKVPTGELTTSTTQLTEHAHNRLVNLIDDIHDVYPDSRESYNDDALKEMTTYMEIMREADRVLDNEGWGAFVAARSKLEQEFTELQNIPFSAFLREADRQRIVELVDGIRTECPAEGTYNKEQARAFNNYTDIVVWADSVLSPQGWAHFVATWHKIKMNGNPVDLLTEYKRKN